MWFFKNSKQKTNCYTKVTKEIETLQKRKKSPGYVDKVPENVRIANDEALARFIGEQEAVLAMVEQYKTWGEGVTV